LNIMSQQIEAGDVSKKVLKSLIKFHGAMPFLELTSISGIDDEQLEQAVSELEEKGLVRIINPDNDLEKIISVTGEGHKLAQSQRSG
jgi:DNA-binding MarR family transcriptional regulator